MVVAAFGVGAVKGVEAWWYRAELARADRELASGRYALALERLERLSARWPGRAEIEYPLGACEAALGHVDAALTAWERVPRDSPLGPRAILDRARLALDHGRLAIAEASIAPLLVDSGEVGRAGVAAGRPGRPVHGPPARDQPANRAALGDVVRPGRTAAAALAARLAALPDRGDARDPGSDGSPGARG